MSKRTDKQKRARGDAIGRSAIDVGWGPLISSGRWYRLWPRGGKQQPSFSDIENVMVDYDEGWSQASVALANEVHVGLESKCRLRAKTNAAVVHQQLAMEAQLNATADDGPPSNSTLERCYTDYHYSSPPGPAAGRHVTNLSEYRVWDLIETFEYIQNGKSSRHRLSSSQPYEKRKIYHTTRPRHRAFYWSMTFHLTARRRPTIHQPRHHSNTGGSITRIGDGEWELMSGYDRGKVTAGWDRATPELAQVTNHQLVFGPAA